MITSVRFPVPVAVIKNDARCEWKPGERGVTLIASYPHGSVVAFVLASGVSEVVCPPGTVIDTDYTGSVGSFAPLDADATEAQSRLQAAASRSNGSVSAEAERGPGWGKSQEHNEPAASEASDSPPPARPIAKGGRVRR